MEAQRARSKESREEIDLTAASALAQLADGLAPCEFTGYGSLTGQAVVQGLLVGGQPVSSAVAGNGETVEVLLDATPFYAESGRWVGVWVWGCIWWVGGRHGRM
jgi:alanyl-tRNA synthetase